MIYPFDTLWLSGSHPFAILLRSLEGKILQGIIPNKFSAYFRFLTQENFAATKKSIYTSKNLSYQKICPSGSFMPSLCYTSAILWRFHTSAILSPSILDVRLCITTSRLYLLWFGPKLF